MYAAHREAERAPTRHAGDAGPGHRRGVLLWLPRLRGLPPRAARGLLVALVPLLWLAGSAVAAEPSTAWHVGHLTSDRSGSWWYGEVADGIAPAVSVDRGSAYSYCPAPPLEPQTCIVVAQGPWTVLTVAGEVLHERGRVYLPGVGR